MTGPEHDQAWDEPVNRVGSTHWQPGGVAARGAELVEYLERLATMPLLRETARTALELLQLRPGQRVLEAGCGAGAFLPPLAQAVDRAGRVVAVDHSPEFVRAAQARMATNALRSVVTVRQADIHRLPFADGEFDAAHCERVLMHLDDPAAALREIRRVVRPGGWVVAAEPDWRGAQIDHPDREALELLNARWLTKFRNPGIGLELNRHFAAAGLVERRIEAMVDYATNLDNLTAYGWDLTPAAEALVSEKGLAADRAARVLRYLTEASQSQQLYAYVGMFVAAGRVPSS
jgi:ubiquinone/menaquinone biosynthesis C-methylase UbiE